jgi:hypothetical protein
MAPKWLKRWWQGGADGQTVREVDTGTANGRVEVSQVPPEPGTPQGRLSQVESDLAMVRLEWAEVLDKINAWANRQAARDRVALKRTLGAAQPGDDEVAIEQEARAAANGDDPPEQLAGVPQSGRLSKIERYRLRNRR